jgi:metal-dependent amidase/aminoacylase/carboxypeptidase family protein
VDRKADAAERFARVEEALVGLSRWMYQHPETAYEERETSARLVELLAANGFEVEYPAFDLETAFAARAGWKGPRS